jgi:hypothetical protein
MKNEKAAVLEVVLAEIEAAMAPAKLALGNAEWGGDGYGAGVARAEIRGFEAALAIVKAKLAENA